MNTLMRVVLLCLCMPTIYAEEQNKEVQRPLVIVTASYNNRAFYKWHLDSIFEQKYDNYRVIHIEDASMDKSPLFIKEYVRRQKQMYRFTLIINKSRRGALANLYQAISSCKDEEIVCILDGDDALSNPDVLSYINRVYADPNVWLTYGQFQEYTSGNIGFCCQIPPDVVAANGFREFKNQPSHLRTFYAGLFKKIILQDLMYGNDFYPMTYDLAMMMPMIEMAGERFKFISDVLYTYNDVNPINDHKVSKELQRKIDIEIRGKKKYQRLEKLFD